MSIYWWCRLGGSLCDWVTRVFGFISHAGVALLGRCQISCHPYHRTLHNYQVWLALLQIWPTYPTMQWPTVQQRCGGEKPYWVLFKLHLSNKEQNQYNPGDCEAG